MNRRFPIVTLVVVGAAIAVFALPPLANVTIYDRAAIGAGEIWRLVTGNWLHFTRSHFGYNILALGLVGCVTEYRGYPHFGLLCLLSATVIGISVFSFEPAPAILRRTLGGCDRRCRLSRAARVSRGCPSKDRRLCPALPARLETRVGMVCWPTALCTNNRRGLRCRTIESSRRSVDCVGSICRVRERPKVQDFVSGEVAMSGPIHRLISEFGRWPATTSEAPCSFC